MDSIHAKNLFFKPIPFQSLAKLSLTACGLGLLIPIVTPLIGDTPRKLLWLIDLVSHWQWLYVLGILLFSAYLALYNYRWLICLVLLPLPLLTTKLTALTQIESTNSVKVASANIYFKNPDLAKLINWLKSTKPDVVIITEVTPAFANTLSAIQDYPYRIIEPELGTFGIALLSKFPISSSVVVRDDDGIPHIEAYLKSPGQKFVVIVFHPMPPINMGFHDKRDNKIRTLAQRFGGKETPAIIAGDFNATPWSIAFKPLAASGWRRATGLLPTWPAWGLGIIGVPIDHVLATRQWRQISTETGPDIGSDHFPVLTTLVLQGQT